MGDFPAANRFHLPVLSVVSREFGTFGAGFSLLVVSRVMTAAGAGAWPNANEAVYVPFVIAAPYLVRTLWWYNGGTAAGNVDIGIYTAGGTLLANAGSTAMSGTQVVQAVSLGTPLLLAPGTYYLGLVSSSATAVFRGMSSATGTLQAWDTDVLRGAGVVQQASAGIPIPATMTPAKLTNWGTSTTNLLPIFGISSLASTLV